MNARAVCAGALLLAALAMPAGAQQKAEWPAFAGGPAALNYSPLTQINRANVAHLQPAWTWATGEKPLAQFHTVPGMFEDTPLMIGGRLYVTTPYNRVVALDPGSGREIWSYDPHTYEDGQPPNGTGYVHRGVAAWRDAASGKLRIFLNTRWRLICLDAATGQPVADFGNNGVVDLSQGLVW